MRNMSSTSMSGKQRTRFVIYCFIFFIVVLIVMTLHNRTSYKRSAKMLNMYLPSSSLSNGFRDNDYDDAIYEAFLEDPYTELFYDTYNEIVKEEYPDLKYEGVSVDMMRDQPTAAADQLMVIYNSLTSDDQDAGEKEWTDLIAKTKDRIRDEPASQNPYADIYEKYGIEKETETEAEPTEAESDSELSAVEQ